MNDESFSSIDRLMEFGMSMAVAQQMIRTMNHAMNNMQAPGAGNSFIAPQPQQYYAVIDGAQVGPMTEEEVSLLIKAKKITEETLVWKPGATAWRVARTMPEINKHLLLNSI